MRGYAALIYVFLYAPIVLIVIFSFNSGFSASDFKGVSLKWYAKAATNTFVIDAVVNSLIVAASSATIGTVFGTMAALALQRIRGTVRAVFDGLIYVAIMVPGIVIGISTLIALVSVFGLLNAALVALVPALSGPEPPLTLGFGSIIAAHTLFNLALVIVIVRARIAGMDRSLIEASADLYATPWRTFRQVTLPLILPAVLAGFLLGFTFSLDDFVVAFFVAGSKTTLPIFVFSSIRRGVTPEINAIGTVVLTVSLVLLFGSQFLLRRGQGRPRPA
jgi:spermidine/putrescine transport system permease protein